MGQKPSTSLADVAALSVRVQKRYLPYLPAYTNHAAAITPDTLVTAKQHWLKIVAGTTAFAAHRGGEREGGTSSEPISFFYDAFFDELFAVAPSARQIFKGQMVRQSKALVGMFTWMVNLDLTQSAMELAARLEGLADRHVAYGCNTTHYDAIGLATFHALRVCSGAADWTPTVQAAWVDIYSVFLLVMVPRTVIKMEELGLDATHCEPLSPRTAELLGVSDGGGLGSSEHNRGGFSPALSPGTPSPGALQQGRSNGFNFSRSLRRIASASTMNSSAHGSVGGGTHGGGGSGSGGIRGGTPRASGGSGTAGIASKVRSGSVGTPRGGEYGFDISKSTSGLRVPKMRLPKKHSGGGGGGSRGLGFSEHHRGGNSNAVATTFDADSSGHSAPDSPMGGREGRATQYRSPRGTFADRNSSSSPGRPLSPLEDALPPGVVPLDLLTLETLPSPQQHVLLPPRLPPRPISASSSTGTDGQKTVAVGAEPTSPSNTSSGDSGESGTRDSGSGGPNSGGSGAGHHRSKTGSILMFVQMAVPEHPAPLPASARWPQKGVRAEGEAVTFEDLSHLACV